MEIDIENQHSTVEGLFTASKSVPPSTAIAPQPLQPISSERQNQQRLPQSPLVSSNVDGNDSPRKTREHRLSDAADVRARIAYLNSISQNNSPTRSTSPTKPWTLSSSHAAIQRAVLGREEAESALATFTAQLESSKARERMVSERVESLMEQLNEARSRQRHERAVYEKEIKQSKKTEYKAELAVIKLQEDLREARSELETYRLQSEHDKAEKEKARQEAFERAYAVAGMTEELQDIKRRLEVAEQERDAAVAMAASRIPMETKPVQKDVTDEQEAGEKRKQPMSSTGVTLFDTIDLDSPDCSIETKYAVLKQENDFLKRQVQEDQETIHFMNMQCQFKACPCRMAEQHGVRFVHDYEYDAKVRAQNAKRRKVEDLQPQLPLPTFKSWKQEQDESRGKQPIRRSAEEQKLHPDLEPDSQDHPSELQAHTPVPETAPEAVIAEQPVAPLPPPEVSISEQNVNHHNSILEEAVNVPLPSLKPIELDTTDDTPEPTAQLEDMTQVIVEPSTSANDFLFRASVTSNTIVPRTNPTLSRSQDVRMSDDLFDISPPKRQIPPRPSTAMGVLSVGSPVRLMPHSPQVLGQRSLTPEVDMPRPMTTQVALNDTSPVRQSRQQRQQTRTNIHDRTRGRSPAPKRVADFDRSSPGPNTVFPITPSMKHERNKNQHHSITQPRPQTAQDHYPKTSIHQDGITKTTTVPLRDDPNSERSLYLNTSMTCAEGPASAPPSATVATFSVPDTPNMTREQALAQIRARRDRARSVNMRKSAEVGSKTPGSVARRGVHLKDRLENVQTRDFSQASAPGRM